MFLLVWGWAELEEDVVRYQSWRFAPEIWSTVAAPTFLKTVFDFKSYPGAETKDEAFPNGDLDTLLLVLDGALVTAGCREVGILEDWTKPDAENFFVLISWSWYC
jgi:hypothetical protein